MDDAFLEFYFGHELTITNIISASFSRTCPSSFVCQKNQKHRGGLTSLDWLIVKPDNCFDDSPWSVPKVSLLLFWDLRSKRLYCQFGTHQSGSASFMPRTPRNAKQKKTGSYSCILQCIIRSRIPGKGQAQGAFLYPSGTSWWNYR